MDSIAALIVALTGVAAFAFTTVQSIRKNRRSQAEKRRDEEIELVKLELECGGLKADVRRLEAEKAELQRQLEVARGRRR